MTKKMVRSVSSTFLTVSAVVMSAGAAQAAESITVRGVGKDIYRGTVAVHADREPYAVFRDGRTLGFRWDAVKRVATVDIGGVGAAGTEIAFGFAAPDPKRFVEITTSPDRSATPLDPGLKPIGTLVPRARPVSGDRRWSISSTCLDRDFADFNSYKALLVPLGIRDVRFQTGWAKCEREKGKFDFAWLDEQVDYCLTNGLNPLLETSYGNPIYIGGGGWDLSGGIPHGEEGLAAWDRWIDALARHFAGRVTDWMMWNEPSNNGGNTYQAIASFNARTAKGILRHVPAAHIGAFSFGASRTNEFIECFRYLGEDAKLFDRYIYHGYEENPDDSYSSVEGIKAIIARFAPHATAWQGENGCPSDWSATFALEGHTWSENTQAKWNVRRMLGDICHDVPSSVFTMCDFFHDAGHSSAGRIEINRKGLLRANESHEVIGVKKAYYAVQNVVTVFGPDAVRVVQSTFSAHTGARKREGLVPKSDPVLSFYEWDKEGHPLYVFWNRSSVPSERFDSLPVTFYSKKPPMREPVWVDLVSGRIYALPAKDAVRHSLGTVYVNVPVCDYPCVLTERAAITVMELINGRGGNESAWRRRSVPGATVCDQSRDAPSHRGGTTRMSIMDRRLRI